MQHQTEGVRGSELGTVDGGDKRGSRKAVCSYLSVSCFILRVHSVSHGGRRLGAGGRGRLRSGFVAVTLFVPSFVCSFFFSGLSYQSHPPRSLLTARLFACMRLFSFSFRLVCVPVARLDKDNVGALNPFFFFFFVFFNYL